MDLLVSTAHDFALVRRGRPVASGRWDTVRAAHATVDATADAPPGGAVCLVLHLDGTEFRARDDAPGWDDFVEAAEAALAGMRPRGDWEATAARAAPGQRVSVYERGAPAS
jgi:hypothetical protein